MFTGIIETQGEVISIKSEFTNIHFEINSELVNEWITNANNNDRLEVFLAGNKNGHN